MLRNGDVDRSIAAVCTPISTVFHSAHTNFTNETINSKMIESKSKARTYDMTFNKPIISQNSNSHMNIGYDNGDDKIKQDRWRGRVPSNVNSNFASKVKELIQMFENDYKYNNPTSDKNFNDFLLTDSDIMKNDNFKMYCYLMSLNDINVTKGWPNFLHYLKDPSVSLKTDATEQGNLY
jgi:hypothetical protein